MLCLCARACMHVCTVMRRVSAWVVRRVLFIFFNQEFIHRKSVSGECEHSISVRWTPKHKMGIFSKKSSNNFYYSLLINGGHVPALNWVGGIFGEIMVRALWYRNQLHRSDRLRCCSVFSTSNALSNVHRFHFQGIIQVTRVWETIIVLAHRFLFQVLY